MTNLFQKAETFFESLWTNDLKPEVTEIADVAKAFFSAAATAAAQQLGAAGLKIVTDAVTAAEGTGGTGAEKLAGAVAKITADLASVGITAATNVINAAIEAAVAQLKTAQPVATVATEDDGA